MSICWIKNDDPSRFQNGGLYRKSENRAHPESQASSIQQPSTWDLGSSRCTIWASIEVMGTWMLRVNPEP